MIVTLVSGKLFLSSFLFLMDKWRNDINIKKINHVKLLQLVLDESGYSAMLKNKKDLENENRLENIKELLNALKEFQPELYDLFARDLSFYNTWNEQEKVNHCFEVCEDISIDFAVMEHAKNIDIVLSNFDWSDLGTWGSLNSHLNHDEKGNSTIGSKTHIFNTEDCIINIENDKTAVIDSLKGYIVIQSEDRLMILKKENEQALKEFVKVTK